jgi:hypothetical protein
MFVLACEKFDDHHACHSTLKTHKNHQQQVSSLIAASSASHSAAADDIPHALATCVKGSLHVKMS